MTGRLSVPRYDSEGVGQSKMPETAELSFKKWYEDACYVVEHLTDGPLMVVSSSNGSKYFTVCDDESFGVKRDKQSKKVANDGRWTGRSCVRQLMSISGGLREMIGTPTM